MNKLDEQIAHALEDARLREHKSEQAKDALVRAAHAAAAILFVGKPTLSKAILKKASQAAYNAILRADREAGVAGHPVASSSHAITELAALGVDQAQRSWREIRDGRGSAAFRAVSRR